MSIEGQGHYLTLAQGRVHTKIQTKFSQDADQLHGNHAADLCLKCIPICTKNKFHPDMAHSNKLAGLTLCLPVSSADNLGKQFGPRSPDQGPNCLTV